MKSFLQIVEEKEGTHNPVVVGFGRMNPPTTGHLKLIDKVREVADKNKAKHKVIVTHTQDSKRNPLSGQQKLKHLKRYSPGTNFETSSKDHPTILHHAAKLYAQGHDHLIMVAGSDRVKEYHDLLHKYNGKEGQHGHYNFKKIEVRSAGHRDPDSEGAEGMSGTKMRDHAKHNNLSSFRQGVPSHVSDDHAKELMKDVRRGMGLNEQHDRGMFKAIFVTGGPGSGKDIVIREAIAESKITELNFTQITDILNDKHRLAMKSMNPRFESVRTRGPLIINGPADDVEKINHIKEELEELGYETMMIFVDTTNEVSKERNTLLSRMMTESIRQDKWSKSQENTKYFTEAFNNFVSFDNTGHIDTKEEDINDIYQSTKIFLDAKAINEAATDWLDRNINLNEKVSELFNEKQGAKNIQMKTVGKYNPFYRKSYSKGPADIVRDNSSSRFSVTSDNTLKGDQIKGNVLPRKDPNGQTTSGGAFHGAYNESAPTLKWNPPQKEPNFNYDNDKNKKLKRGNKSLGPGGRVGKPDGIGSTLDTRAGGQGAAGGSFGAGLGDQTYSEENRELDRQYSNASQNGTAMLGAKLEPNPLSEKKPFDKFRKSVKKEAIDHHTTDMGVGGTLSGAGNKEGLDTYFDKARTTGTYIKSKNKKNFNKAKDDNLIDGGKDVKI